MPQVQRRQLLGGVASLLVGSFGARSQIVDVLPWRPDAGDPPQSLAAGGWMFFTPAEAATIEAAADRLIPPDETTAGGKDAGCAVYLDRQLAGPYGSRRGLYVSPPFLKGQKNQGPQDRDGPAATYRKALAALDAYVRQHKGDIFPNLAPNDQDEILKGLERGDVKLEGVDGQSFFETLLKAIQEGFFADPIYGGNRDMCAWKMIGFPGARYDYRDWIGRHNQRFPLGPASIMGAPDWTPPTNT
jgi:gluconate 2-dehydrogenase gamma chain